MLFRTKGVTKIDNSQILIKKEYVKSGSDDEMTTDTFFNGRLKVVQAKGGYRFSIDAIILAHHVKPGPIDTILDLGTGCGIIPMVLAYRHSENKIYGVELQENLAKIANMNLAANCLEDRITIFHHDMKTFPLKVLAGPVDIVVANPPYRKANAGRINPDPERAVARHEIGVTLAGVVGTAKRMLQTMGRFITIYPAERVTDLITTLRDHNIEPKLLRTVHSNADSEAKLILLEAVKNGKSGVKIAQPLVIYENHGGYTDEVKRMLLP